jgi:hypothetical protein
VPDDPPKMSDLYPEMASAQGGTTITVFGSFYIGNTLWPLTQLLNTDSVVQDGPGNRLSRRYVWSDSHTHSDTLLFASLSILMVRS